MVKPELLEAHKEQVAIRALEKLLKSRKPNTVPKHLLSPGTSIWAFHKTSKQNEKPQWVRAKVTEVTPHIIYARRSTRGPPMKVAYEDLRLAPTGKLTAELLSCSLEDELSHAEDNAPEGEPQQETPLSTSTYHSSLITASQEAPTSISRINSPIENAIPAPDDPPPERVNSPMGAPEKDIGDIKILEDVAPLEKLTSNRDQVLDQIYEKIGPSQVSRSKISFAPPWIADEAFRNEHDSNWASAYDLVHDSDVPNDANVISSHTVYKIKTIEDK